MNPLADRVFLKKLDLYKNKIIYVKLISLDLDENPIEVIEGRATGGSINIDGKSAVRRSCNITLITDDIKINNYYWSLKTKVNIFIGVKNEIDSKYPEIIWFPQGIYVITSFSSSYSTSGFTINIQGRDKMCLLNGELGGMLTYPIDFARYINTDGTKIDLPILDIITGIVHTYGGEKIDNIEINDLSKKGKFFSKFINTNEFDISDKVFYILAKKGEPFNFNNVLRNSENDKYNIENFLFKYDGHTKSYSQKYDYLNDNYELTNEYIITITGKFYIGNTDNFIVNPSVYLYKPEPEQICGYQNTELTYPAEDLICQPGDNFTTPLNKLVSFLGDYEYFYNLNGKFIFQKKKTSFNNLVYNEEDLANFDASMYNFSSNEQITSINTNPNLNELKNDYTIWGKLKNNVSIHFRYAIDKKPISYTLIGSGHTYYSDLVKEKDNTRKYCNWRHLIYLMAKDYQEYHLTNQWNNTGYEQYYTDMIAFWPEIYDVDNLCYKDDIQLDGLKFWLEFLDTDGQLSQYSVKNIGQRQLVKTDEKVRRIENYNIPNYLFITDESEAEDGYINFKINENNIDIAAQGKDAKSEILNCLSNNSISQEQVSISAIPVYYLEPNNLIYVYDDKVDLDNEYIINSISIPLQYNGLMTLNGYKKPQPIY